MIENAHFMHKKCCFSSISMPRAPEKMALKQFPRENTAHLSLSSLASVYLASSESECFVTHDIRAEACHFGMNLK